MDVSMLVTRRTASRLNVLKSCFSLYGCTGGGWTDAE
jgi:hypothetical protein